MTEDTAKPGQDALAPLPEPAPEVPPLAEAAPDVAAKIAKRMGEIDMANSQSIIHFGAAAQGELTAISASMLEGVKNKDLGPAGDSLRDIVATIRGFSVKELEPGRKRSWWERLTGSGTSLARFMEKFEEVQGQIDRITEDLDRHEHKLLIDIKALDLLYQKALGFYDELALYIAAGEAKLGELDTASIPAAQTAAETAPETEKMLKAQALRDLRAARDDLDRRVHDLRLTRQVTMQSLPSIRLVQENDKSLVTKIGSTLVNTVPLWQSQLAQAVTVQRSQQAASAIREANDLTNTLLTENAEMLQNANRETRTQMERGVFDVEAVQKANDALIATIAESLKIADDGKAKRAAAEAQLAKMEADLRGALAAARTPAKPAPDGGAKA
ncbi:toxic anion resistance protein [Solirhodobacter olei]|uniref:toxic anion resistance protein n=1 Tax=Solirhodobacter olei TaxID=2493082 RepID=UPI000FD9C14E|nr:toxic anion resistance protein [Solirhodobacter olei]